MPKKKAIPKITSQECCEVAHASLVQARAAVMSAVLALENKGVLTEVAMMLRTSALVPIASASWYTNEGLEKAVANG